MTGFPLMAFDNERTRYLYLFLVAFLALVLILSVIRFLKLMDKSSLTTPMKHYQADKLKKKHFSDLEVLKYMRINYFLDAVASLICLILMLYYEEGISFIIFIYLAAALIMKIVEKRLEWADIKK